MNRWLYSSLAVMCFFSSCFSPSLTSITDVVEIPLHTTTIPSKAWQDAPLRAQSQYVLYGANSTKEKKARIGDYYYVSWYDCSPQSQVRLVMSYTQSATGSRILQLEERMDEPRDSEGSRKTKFFFTGKDRARRGDILSWRMDLYVDGQLSDTKRSYLWMEEGDFQKKS